jgi:hypothetical protein
MNIPAFPSTYHNGWGEPEKGMTLRDYFAAKAMQGMCANPNCKAEVGEDKFAEAAYEVADAMMKARKV